MPKPQIVFRAALEEDESDDGDDEIEIIPFVKPPPVVIDLLESDSGNESCQDGNKKSSKKKSKKKKGKRDKERSRESGSTDVASLGNRVHNESSVSSLVVDFESRASDCLPDDNNECVEEITGGQVVEPATSSEDVNNGSGNVAAESKTSAGASSEAPLNSVPSRQSLSGNGASGNTSSHFEKCLDAQSTEVVNDKRTETGMEMAGATPAQSNDKQKKVKSKERKPRGEGKSRTRTLSATQRTNEEIVNFLTTLGIQMDANAFETPVTRRRQSRKRPTQIPSVAESEGNSLDSSATNSNDGQNFPAPITGSSPTTSGAYVSVTQENSSSSKRDQTTPKGKRQRQAISGDLSDYTISFTNKDLSAINTSFQSNVVVPETDNRLDDVVGSFISVSSSDQSKQKIPSRERMKPSYYTEVIDAVARGLDSTVVSSAVGTGASVIISTANETAGYNAGTEPGINPRTTEMEVDDFSPANQSENDACNTEHTLRKDGEEIISSAPDANGNDLNSETIQEAEPQEKGGNKSVPGDGTSVTTGANIMESVLKGVEEGENKTTDRGADKNTQDADRKSSRESGSKRKIDVIEISEEEENSDIVTVETPSKGKENSNLVRRSPERKRHRLSSKSSTSDIRKTDKSKSVQDHGTNSILTPVYQMSTDNVVANPCHTPRESYFPSTWSNHMRDFYGAIRCENLELDDIWPTLSDSEDLWKAYKDMMPPPKNKRRHVRCDRCKQLGHLIKECKEKWKPPTCHYCGKTGHTSDNHSRHSRTCPGALCLNCGRSASRYAQKCHRCLLQSRPNRCEICNVPGHDKLICPDNWRRYHSVTSPDAFKKTEEILKTNTTWNEESHRKAGPKDASIYKRPSTMYCANCGRRGHSFYECNGSKFNPYPRNKPFVILEASTSDAAATSIPISYDSRTGRAVVLNAETSDKPELAVETIQVKITNELALRNDIAVSGSKPSTNQPKAQGTSSRGAINHVMGQSVVIQNVPDAHALEIGSNKASHKFTCGSKGCRNRLRTDEKCYQALMEAQAHLKLFRAQQKGLLKPLEEKRKVQISVLNDGCKIHIYGSSVLETDQDLHKLVRMTSACRQTRTEGDEENISKEIVNAICYPRQGNVTTTVNVDERKRSSDIRTPSTPRSVQMVTDEEDECCIIVEIPANVSTSKTKDTSPEKNDEKSNNPITIEWIEDRREITSKSFLMDQSPSATNKTQKPSKDTGTTEAKNTTAEQTSDKNSSTKHSWLEYESPLTGLPLSYSTDHSRTKDNEQESENAPTDNLRNISNEERPISGDREPTKDNCQTPETEQRKNSDLPVPAVNVNEDKNMTEADIPDDSSDGFECEEFDYSKMDMHGNVGQPQSQNTNENMVTDSSDSDLEVLDPPPPPVIDGNVEIITIDDEEDVPTPRKETVEETVTLLPSEWKLAMAELAKRDNIISQISHEFKVHIMVSKESSSMVITQGTGQALKMAKDELVFWLESKCLNTDYHFVRRRPIVEESPSPGSSTSKRKKKPKQRVLKLHDVQKLQHNPFVQQGPQKSIKKRKKKPKRKVYQFHQSTFQQTDQNSNQAPSTSSQSFISSTSSISQLSNFNSKRNFKKSNSSSKGLLHSPTPKRMQQRNSSSNDNNNGSGFWKPNSKADKPRKTRYFQA